MKPSHTKPQYLREIMVYSIYIIYMSPVHQAHIIIIPTTHTYKK